MIDDQHAHDADHQEDEQLARISMWLCLGLLVAIGLLVGLAVVVT